MLICGLICVFLWINIFNVFIVVKKGIVIFVFICNLLPSYAQKFPVSYYRAQAALDNGELSKARIWIDSATLADPKNPVIWIKKGEIQFNTSNYSSAISDFVHADKLRSGISSIWLARSYAILGDTANAFQYLKSHLESTGKESEASIILDKSFSNLTNTPQWKKLWLTDWYSGSEKLIADVKYHFKREQWVEAIDLLNQRIEGRSASHQYYALRGEAYFKTGSYRAAEADFTHAVKKSKRNHVYLSWRAKIFIKQAKFKNAIKDLNQAIEFSGGVPAYFLLRAEALAGNGKIDLAIVDIEHYLSFYPSDIIAIELYANLAVQSGKYLTALSQIGKLIKTFPNEPRYYIQRANIYMKSNNWAVAELDYTMSLDFDPNNAEVYIQKGLCRYYQNNLSGACSDWKNALRLGSFEAQELLFRNCKGEK